MGFNMQKLMQQAQKMQRDAARVQEELANTEIEGTAGGNMVRVIVSGNSEVRSISINPEIVDPEDTEMLEDMILAALKDALSTASALAAEKMNAVTGGMKLPGM
jgi:DNA-binding YbaB/EbfC family protein